MCTFDYIATECFIKKVFDKRHILRIPLGYGLHCPKAFYQNYCLCLSTNHHRFVYLSPHCLAVCFYLHVYLYLPHYLSISASLSIYISIPHRLSIHLYLTVYLAISLSLSLHESIFNNHSPSHFPHFILTLSPSKWHLTPPPPFPNPAPIPPDDTM